MIRVSIDNAELNKLNKNFEKHALKVNQAANEGLKRAGMKILAKAQSNLKEAGSIATGALINSGRVQSNPDYSVDVRFDKNYASSVEFGQKAGTVVSIKALKEWIKKKGIMDTKTALGKRKKRGVDFEKKITGLAFAIRNIIKERGTKAKPYLYPAMRENENEVLTILKQAIKQVL